MTHVVDVAGGTPPVPGVAEGKVCATCEGDGTLDSPDGREQALCHDCDGTGGRDPLAVAKAVQFSLDYKAALGLA